MRAFVGEVSVEQQHEDQIARWNSRICPQIAGLQRRDAEIVADRLARRAAQIGLRPSGSGCRANILIFVTPDADRFTAELTAQFPQAFQPRLTNMYHPDEGALARFVGSDAPVRWWHISQTVAADGWVVANADERDDGYPQMRTGVSPRMQRTTRQDFNQAIVVVDATQASGVLLDTLADYLAMVALAQINPDADTSRDDTILNLFATTASEDAAPTMMSDWDLAYLDGIYGARRNAMTAERQEADIVEHMRASHRSGDE